MAFAWLVPPALAVAHGGTLLPAWSAWLLPAAALVILPPFWRSALGRVLPARPEGPALTAGEEATPVRGGSAITDTPGSAAEEDNLLLQIARSRSEGAAGAQAASLADRPGPAEAQVVEEEFEIGDTMEVEYNVRHLDADQPDGDRQAASTGMEGQAASAGMEGQAAGTSPKVAAPASRSRLHMVPASSPAGMPMSLLLERALAARAANDPQQTVSWFLAALSRNPEPMLRADIVLDLCAALKACGYRREALAVLAVEHAAGTDPAWCERIRAELMRGGPC